VVRRFAFIIADIKPTLVKVLKQHDFKSDWNPKVSATGCGRAQADNIV